MRHGSEPFAIAPSDRIITGVRYVSAIRAASTATSKQSDGDCGAITATGDSPLRPYSACSRSACSVLVGRPVDGPPRCTSTTSSGSSVITREADGLGLQRDAGAGGAGDAERTAVGRADCRADAGDLVLGLEGQDVEVLVLGQLVQDVRRRRDRVAAEHHLDVGELTGRDDAVGQRGVARDLPVLTGLQLGRATPRRWCRTPRWSRRSSSRPSAPARWPRRYRACGRTSRG